jgi:hypothetical protein
VQGGVKSWGAALETFCVGVDLGQSIDHTAICVMSKLPAVPDPERNKFFEPGQDPVDNRQEYCRIADEMAARATPDHPDVRDGAVEHFKQPLVNSTDASGSLEWAER